MVDISAILKVAGTLKDVDLKMKISDLVSENLELKKENSELKEVMKKMSDNSQLKSKIKLKDRHYYIEEEGPYCTKCWDDEEKLIRVPRREGSGYGDGSVHAYYTCPKCKTELGGRERIAF